MKTQNKKKELSKTEQLSYEYARLKPFLAHAYLLNAKELKILESKTDIEDKVGFLQRVLFMDRGITHAFSDFVYDEPQDAGKKLLKELMNPDNFPYTCKLLFNIDLMPFQHVILKELWIRPFPMLVANRGAGKSWILGLYTMLRLLFTQGCKVAIVGGSFRQAKGIFEYMEKFWYGGDIYRDIIGTSISSGGKQQGPRHSPERWDMTVGDSMAICLPLGDGSKIRGQRANYLLADELASINEQIFNDTVFGFAAVSSAPVDKVVDIGSVNLLKAAGMWSNELQREIDKKHKGNQVVLSGTADYTFGHFYKTYKLYKSVIQCGNDENKLKEQLGEKFNTGLRAEDCVVVRLPATLLPEGFMDKKIIAVARAKLPAEVFQKEYDATFPNDSAGFYKMSLLLACTCPIKTQDDEIMFEPLLHGSPNYKYVLAIDPASEQDKLAITIIECRHNHRRIVYCWSTKKTQHSQLIAKGLVKEHDYFRYAADKIRELMTRFNIVEIACDAGGGGYAIREALGSPRSENQLPIYELKDPPDTKQPKMTDEMQGLHILNMIQFSNAKWVSDANYGLKLDFEQKTLIFPFYDLVSEEISLMEDKQQGRVVYNEKTGEEVRLYDSIISNHEEIQELKKELASISHSKTAANRERWDLPKHKGPDGKLITETKDRYSSLLMGNAIARLITANDLLPPKQETKIFGGRTTEFVSYKNEQNNMYLSQPSWVKDVSGWGVVKK